ncbi:MAG: polysaccharide biosynthesis C-terminal domain-containing protein, partial [Bacteroidales bacterium]|nr:polysaccharide biosynthesis C-terminal domain-containing protein [Bacteroidales bacterium]
FRFASKENIKPDSVFSSAFSTVGIVCLLFFIGVTCFSGNISTSLGYQGFSNIIIYVAAILLIDCVTAIVFARLRYEHKAVKFAVIKTLKILTELGTNLLLYLTFPKFAASHPDTFLLRFISPTPDFTYAIFGILVSCIVCVVLLIPELLRLSPKIDKAIWKPLMLYSLPLMIAGLPGVLNDFLDRILMRFMNADPIMWRADLGVYQAGVKIAVIMSLFVQMFRYAAEPFFFQREREKGNKEMYSKVMTYFVAFCMFGFLFVMLYIDAIGLMLGRNFREGLAITPIMLFAYVLLGMLFNVSMWYKLSGKTGYAVWITLAGLAVTIAVNVLFMPKYSYYAAAWGHVASYLVMMIISLILGNKYYPIPYRWGRIIFSIVFALAIYGGSLLLPELAFWPKMAVSTVLLGCYTLIIWLTLFRKPIRYESQNS